MIPVVDVYHWYTSLVCVDDGETLEQKRKRETRTFFGLTVFGLLCVALFFCTAPSPASTHCEGITVWWILTHGRNPASIEKTMLCAQAYQQEHQGYLILGFMLTYVVFHSFAIPGGMCLFLNILAGATFPLYIAEGIVMLCATLGAILCFMLSYHIGGGVISVYNLDSMLEDYRQKVNDNRHRLFMFLVLTRCTPVPAVLINLASPLLGIPIGTFITSTIVGQVPLNTVHILAGYSMAQTGTFEAGSMKWIMIGGVLVTVYVAFGSKIKELLLRRTL